MRETNPSWPIGPIRPPAAPGRRAPATQSLDDELLRVALERRRGLGAGRELVDVGHELHRVGRRLADDLHQPLVDAERDPVARPVGPIPVGVTGVDRHLHLLEVVAALRVAERVRAHPDPRRRRPDVSAEDLADADLGTTPPPTAVASSTAAGSGEAEWATTRGPRTTRRPRARSPTGRAAPQPSRAVSRGSPASSSFDSRPSRSTRQRRTLLPANSAA